MSDGVEVGDNVNIFFEYSPGLFGVTIKYMPCATGDAFRVVDKFGNVYLVQNYSYMSKIKKENDER